MKRSICTLILQQQVLRKQQSPFATLFGPDLLLKRLMKTKRGKRSHPWTHVKSPVLGTYAVKHWACPVFPHAYIRRTGSLHVLLMLPGQCPRSSCIAAKTIVLSFLKGIIIDIPNASIFWTTHDIHDTISNYGPQGRETVSYFLLQAQISCLSEGSKQNQDMSSVPGKFCLDHTWA